MNQPRRTPEINMHAIMIQGDSVRMTWGVDEPSNEPRKPVRRDAPPTPPVAGQTESILRVRLAEELDYARRILDATGNELSADPIAVSRHPRTLQSLDIVGQLLGHIAKVVRSSDAQSAVDGIGMSDLKARLLRRNSL